MLGLSLRASHARFTDQMPIDRDEHGHRRWPTRGGPERSTLSRRSALGRIPSGRRRAASRGGRPPRSPRCRAASRRRTRPRARSTPGRARRERSPSRIQRTAERGTRPRPAQDLGRAHRREEAPRQQPERQEPRVPHRVLGPLDEQHAEHERGDERARASSGAGRSRPRRSRRPRAARSTTATTAAA